MIFNSARSVQVAPPLQDLQNRSTATRSTDVILEFCTGTSPETRIIECFTPTPPQLRRYGSRNFTQRHVLHNPHQRPNQLQDVGEFGVVSSNPGGRVGFSTDEPKPPLTAPIGLEARNWLWKRVDLAKKSLALIPIVRNTIGSNEFRESNQLQTRTQERLVGIGS